MQNPVQKDDPAFYGQWIMENYRWLGCKEGFERAMPFATYNVLGFNYH